MCTVMNARGGPGSVKLGNKLIEPNACARFGGRVGMVDGARKVD